MSKLYLMVFIQIDRDELTKLLDSQKTVHNWFYSMSNSIFIKTTLSSKELSALILKTFGEKRHFVTEVVNYYGWLPDDHWKLFN